MCDNRCQPAASGREIFHEHQLTADVLERHQDRITGLAFRDDLIDADGVQAAGDVGWRLQVNDEVVEAGIVDMERVLADQLGAVRRVLDALGKVRQRRND